MMNWLRQLTREGSKNASIQYEDENGDAVVEISGPPLPDDIRKLGSSAMQGKIRIGNETMPARIPVGPMVAFTALEWEYMQARPGQDPDFQRRIVRSNEIRRELAAVTGPNPHPDQYQALANATRSMWEQLMQELSGALLRSVQSDTRFLHQYEGKMHISRFFRGSRNNVEMAFVRNCTEAKLLLVPK